MVCFRVGRFRSWQSERIYQTRTGCNRLSLSRSCFGFDFSKPKHLRPKLRLRLQPLLFQKLKASASASASWFWKSFGLSFGFEPHKFKILRLVLLSQTLKNSTFVIFKSCLPVYFAWISTNNKESRVRMRIYNSREPRAPRLPWLTFDSKTVPISPRPQSIGNILLCYLV